MVHAMPRLSPWSRLELVRRVLAGRPAAHVAAEMGISRTTAYKWLARYRADGAAGLRDRSSRPQRSPRRTPGKLVHRIERLRRRRHTGIEIAQEIGLSAATVSRILQRLGLARLWRVDEQEAPPQRYEHARPGALVHIDAKRFGKIGQVGHRIHGDYRRRSRGVGWETVFVDIKPDLVELLLG